jgi:membrane associated rhomboid family serine protease
MSLLIINVAAYLVQIAVEKFTKFPIDSYFALSVEGLRYGYVWQLLTFQFMHGSVTHLLFNCLGIYLLGGVVEEALGRKPFLTLYFSSGVIGGLFQILAGILVPHQFGGATVGASAGVFGLVAAFATLFPEQPLYLFFVVPVPAKYLLLLELLCTALGMALPPKDPFAPHIAHAAHVGGMLAGVAFIRYAVHWHWPRFRRTERQPLRRLVKVHSQQSNPWATDKDVIEEEVPPEEFVSKEVDPILDKISAHGIQSLTERERKILESARQKMAKR